MYTAIPSQANLVFEGIVADYSSKEVARMFRRIDYSVKLMTELISSKPPNFKFQDHGVFDLSKKSNNAIWLDSPYG